MPIEACDDLGQFFRDLVTRALNHQRVDAEPATADYVTGLLVHCADPSQHARMDRPLVHILDEALHAGAGHRLDAFLVAGDAALTRLGMFPGAVDRDAVTGLYVRVGAFAYREAAQLARSEAGTEPVALAELSEQFPRFVDVVAEVAESASLGAVCRDVVTLYDRWKSGQSQRALDLLVKQGMFPTQGDKTPC